jgi:hypothetical protein
MEKSHNKEREQMPKHANPKHKKEKIKNLKEVTFKTITIKKPKKKRKKQKKEILSPDNSYVFNGIEKVKFEFSKEGYPFLDFENLRIIPFNVSFNTVQPYTYMYIKFQHTSIHREYTTAGITTTLGIHFRIPTSYTKHFSKKEKIFLQFLRSYVAEHKTLTSKELEVTELEWNKPKVVYINIDEETING